MKNLDIGNIKSVCLNKIFQMGVNYYLNDHVFNLNIIKDDHSGDFFTIKSKVSSKNLNEYDVNLWVTKDNMFFDGECTCEYYKGNHEVCKHIVSAYLTYLNEYAEKKEKVYDIGLFIKSKKETPISEIELLMKTYENANKSNEVLKLPLNFELTLNYEITTDSFAHVQLKVGTERLYVVKSIKNFLSSVLNEEPLDFGKNFTLDLSKQYFSEEDKQIIDFLQNIYISNNVLSNNYYTTNSLVSGKNLKLLHIQIDNLLNTIKSKTINLSLPQGEFTNIPLLRENMNIEFDILSKNDEILISHKNTMPFPLSASGQYFFYNNSIYKINKDQWNTYVPIFTLLSKKKERFIKIKEADKSNFASFILPRLKDLGNIYMQEDIKEDFYEENLISYAYLDKNNSSLLCKIKFNYGETNINPLVSTTENNNRGFLLRNLKEEEKTINLLKEYNFEEKNEVFELNDEDKILDFQVYGLSKLQELAEVYCSEEFKKIKIYTSSSYKTSIKLNNDNMLEFNFTIEDIDKKEILNILKAIKSNKKYYKLKNKNYVLLNEEPLTNINSMLDYLDIKDSDFLKEKLLINKYNAPYIESKLSSIKNEHNIITKNKEYRELINSLKDIKDIDFSIPEELVGDLRAYQDTGYKWLKTLGNYGFGGILADEMGLGKTIQAIAYLCSEKSSNPSLVVCPTSLIYNWKEEFEKFSPSLKILVLYGNKDEREGLVKSFKDFDIVITSYPIIRRDVDNLKDVEFNCCFLDEAQQIKNSNSQNAKCVKDLNCKKRFALTGTPIENTLSELWSIFDFIMPGYLLSEGKFRTKFETPIIKNKNLKVLQELNRKISPFILRRLKKDVVKELPPKIEKKVIVELSEEQKKLYASYVSLFKNEIDQDIKEKGLNKSKIKILSVLTRLRQLCCDPSTFINDYKGESSKINVLYELLQNGIDEGHKILVFSQFTSVLKNISIGLRSLNIEHMYLDGTIKSQDRMVMVNEFNSGNSQVFLISLKAGGSGLNLTSADIVIHFDPWWNPAVEDQATDRAHRIGQNNTVEVIKLVSKGTIEEKIYNLQEKKKEIINKVMGEEAIGESLIGSMSLEDIQELFL